jgi:hypothetical protein
MAGTFSEQATLASDNVFIAKVRVALIARAVEQYYNATAQPFSVLNQARGILNDGGQDAARVAWLVIAADANIKAAAPTVPSDSATQAAVNVVLTALLK